MKINLVHVAFAAVLTSALLFAAQEASGLGGDYSTNQIVHFPGHPKGFAELVNRTNRVHGYFLNFSETFFFKGDVQDFTAFLDAYSRIPVGGKHQVTLHPGVGEAKSPWAKLGRSCDWELYACPKGVLDALALLDQGTNSVAAVQSAVKDTNYVIVVHYWTGGFWTGGDAAMAGLHIPSNVEVKKAE